MALGRMSSFMFAQCPATRAMIETFWIGKLGTDALAGRCVWCFPA